MLVEAIAYKSAICGISGCRISAALCLIFMCSDYSIHTQPATHLWANIIGGAMKNDVLWLIRVTLPVHLSNSRHQIIWFHQAIFLLQTWWQYHVSMALIINTSRICCTRLLTSEIMLTQRQIKVLCHICDKIYEWLDKLSTQDHAKSHKYHFLIAQKNTLDAWSMLPEYSLTNFAVNY